MPLTASPEYREWRELVARFAASPVPLLQEPGAGDRRVRAFSRTRPDSLFPGARSAAGALAGILLMSGCWTEAHDTANDLHTAEGSYWHALVHRMEPDTWNSNYWFRKVGYHALFPKLLDEARAIAGGLNDAGAKWFPLGQRWDPERFNALCDQARTSADGNFVKAVEEIHTAEVHLLWEWCVAGGDTIG